MTKIKRIPGEIYLTGNEPVLTSDGNGKLPGGWSPSRGVWLAFRKWPTIDDILWTDNIVCIPPREPVFLLSVTPDDTLCTFIWNGERLQGYTYLLKKRPMNWKERVDAGNV